ncbi:MAG: HEAT repeat domain-containing protein, partial [Dehalococcoidia bacterium]|nr:HEAT repeat domain-containing protein [Dehalococcoidia bacterium]
LIKSIEHDPSLKVRIAATMALSKYTLFAEMGRIQASKKRDIERVLIKLVNDTKEDEELRRRALETVSVISIPEAKLLIEEAYGSDSHSMKVGAVFSMGQSCDTSWLPILYKEVSNKDPEIKYEVARALGEMGEQGSVSYLATLAEDLDPQVAASALDALGKIGGKESRGILEKYRQKGDKSLASAAEDALEYLDEEEKPIIFDYQR